jgi:hypothetical protein
MRSLEGLPDGRVKEFAKELFTAKTRTDLRLLKIQIRDACGCGYLTTGDCADLLGIADDLIKEMV